MLKTLMLTITSLALLSTVTMADDDLLAELSTFDVAAIADADISIEDDMLADLDVDQLSADAGTEDDAIEACFRRFGYRSYGGYGYNYGCYNYCRPCYRPCYQHYYVHRPVYTVTYCPVYTHWGCY